MKRLVNPFHYVAGGKALTMGLALLLLQSCWLHALGLYQNAYLHFGPASAGFPLWKTGAIQLSMWFVPALLLYGCGRMLSPSRIRIIDLLGTTALAQGPLLLLLVPFAIPSANELILRVTERMLADGTLPTPGESALLVLVGIYSIAALAFFFVRNYQAYSVSCNLRGPRAVGSYIAVVFVATLVSQWTI